MDFPFWCFEAGIGLEIVVRNVLFIRRALGQELDVVSCCCLLILSDG